MRKHLSTQSKIKLYNSSDFSIYSFINENKSTQKNNPNNSYSNVQTLNIISKINNKNNINSSYNNINSNNINLNNNNNNIILSNNSINKSPHISSNRKINTFIVKKQYWFRKIWFY